VAFAHPGEQWADRIHDVPPATARAGGQAGVDTNADHLAAWRLDPHGNLIGQPLRFGYDVHELTPGSAGRLLY
jgi:hypothetical protein